MQKALSDDQMLADSGIRVASVNKGVVLLSGSAKSLETHLKVVEAVKAVRGVARVATEVQFRDVRSTSQARLHEIRRPGDFSRHQQQTLDLDLLWICDFQPIKTRQTPDLLISCESG